MAKTETTAPLGDEHYRQPRQPKPEIRSVLAGEEADHEYALVGEEKTLDPLSPEDFSLHAEAIFELMRRGTAEHWSREQKLAAANERFVTQEQNPQLQTFAEILLEAGMQRQLQELVDRVDTGGAELTPKLSELRKKGHERMLSYNHKLRGVITRNPDAFSQDELVGWLSRASGDQVWADGQVRGVAAEIASLQEIKRLPGVTHARFGNAAEDRAGGDVVVEFANGLGARIDIKSREREASGKHRGVTLLVEPHMVEDFAISPHYKRQFKVRFAQALQHRGHGAASLPRAA